MGASLSMLETAVQMLRVGRYALAINLLERVVADQPNNPRAHHTLALALRGSGALDEAKTAAQTALSLQETAQGLSVLGQICLQQGDVAEGLDALRRVHLPALSPALQHWVHTVLAGEAIGDVSMDDALWPAHSMNTVDTQQLLVALRDAPCVVVLAGNVNGTPHQPRHLWDVLNRDEGTSIWRFRENPVVLWSVLASWLEQPQLAPQPIHHALAALPVAAVVTEEISGLHQQAGATEVIELNGSIQRTRCDGCGQHYRVPVKGFVGGPLPPRCGCGQPLRPDVRLFGEPMDRSVAAQAAHWLARADVIVVLDCDVAAEPFATLLEGVTREKQMHARSIDVVTAAQVGA